MTYHIVPPWVAGFESLSWPDQLAQLRALDNAASGLGGRTAEEAEHKRRSLLKHYGALRRVHDAQVRTWIETPATFDTEEQADAFGSAKNNSTHDTSTPEVTR